MIFLWPLFVQRHFDVDQQQISKFVAASERDEFQDWDQIAEAVAKMPAAGVRRFMASLVTQWAIAGRDLDELAAILGTELENIRRTDQTDE
jgi:hypothetical protein